MALIFSAAVLITLPIFIILMHWGGNPFQSRVITIAASFPIGLTAAMLLTSLGTTAMPTGISGFLALAMLVAVGILARRDARKKRVPLWKPKGSLPHQGYVVAIAVLASLFLVFLIWKSFMIFPDGSGIVANKAAPDTPYHLAQVTRIALTNKWDFQEPNFSGEFIRYPFLVNMSSGLLAKVGVPLDIAFHAPVALLTIADMFLLAGFLSFLGLRPLLIGITVVGFLLGGSLGYIAYIETGGLAGLPLRTGEIYPMQNISYPSVIPGFLLAQRPFLLGLGLFIASLWLFLRGLKEQNIRWLVFSGVVAGLLPLAHMHSFIAIVLVAAAMVAWLFIKRHVLFFDSVRGFVFSSFLVAVVPLALWALLPRFPMFSIVAFRLGWMSAPGEVGSVVLGPDSNLVLSWASFMITNFGPLLFLPLALLLIAIWHVRKREFSFLLALSLGGLALWITPNLIRFQAWDLDTNKFFAYALLLSLAAASMAVQELRNIRMRIAAVGVLIIMVCFSVPSSLIASFQILRDPKPVSIFSADELHIAQWLREQSPDDASVLSSAFFADSLHGLQSSVAVASGRKLTIGFRLWHITHGVNDIERFERVQEFLENPAEQKLSADIPADYLLVDTPMRTKYPFLEKALSDLGYSTAVQSGQLVLIAL